MALGVAAMLFAPALLVRTGVGLRGLLAFSELCLALPAVAVLLARASLRPAVLGREGASRRLWLASFAAGPALWVLSLGLFELQYAVWPPPPGYLEAFRLLHDRLRPHGLADGIVSLLTIAAVPALCEELVFRGVVLSSLLRPLGLLGASFGSALLFGLIHLDRVPGDGLSLYRVPFAFVVGLGFAALRLSRDSLLPPALAHATLNAITFFAAPFADDPAAGLPAPRPLLGLGLLGLGLGSTLVALRALRRR
jgi:membrane protease YdiL (CAAX protease family)